MAPNNTTADMVKVEVLSGPGAGHDFKAWTGVSMTRALDKAASSFDLSMPRTLQARWTGMGLTPLGPGDGVRVSLGSDAVLTGWVDTLAPVSDPERHDILASGRSLTCDAVDCSVITAPLQWKKISLLNLARLLVRPFGLHVKGDAASGVMLETVTVEQGETVFELLERQARIHGFMLRDDAEGALLIVRPGNRRAVTELRHLYGPNGEPDPTNNVKSSTGNFNHAERFSQITVKGQSGGGQLSFGAAEAAISATVKDAGVTRHRPLVILAGSAVTKATAKARAEWELARRVGKSAVLTHVVPGWRQVPDGPLWDANLIVPLTDHSLGVEAEMLVTSVSWSLNDREGAITTLTLEDPSAWTPKPRALVVEGTQQWAAIEKQFKDK